MDLGSARETMRDRTQLVSRAVSMFCCSESPMAHDEYVLQADEPFWKKIPLWGWAVVAAVVLLVIGSRAQKARERAEFEDYLK